MLNYYVCSLLLGLPLLVTGCSDPPKSPVAEEKAFQNVSTKNDPDSPNIESRKLMKMFELDKVILLESLENSVIGHISLVEVVPASGDLIVLDRRSTKKVFRFSSNGAFKNSIGSLGDGPGEYSKAFDIAISGSDKVAIGSPFKVGLYELDGRLINEFKTQDFFDRIGAFGDHIAIFYNQKDQRTVFYDNQFNLKKVLDMPDPRSGLQASSFQMFAKHQGQLLITRPYDLAYYQVGPSLDSKLITIMEQNAPTEEKIGIVALYGAIGGSVVLLEGNPKMPRYSMYNPDNFSFVRFESLLRDDHHYPFDGIVGVYDNGIIAMIDSEVTFRKNIDRYPLLADSGFDPKKNPALVKLKIKEETKK